MQEIDSIIREILKLAPPKYNGLRYRFSKGRLGINAKVALLEAYGYTVSFIVHPPKGTRQTQ